MRAAKRQGAGTRPADAITLGSARYAIPAGRRATVRIRLNARGLGLLRTAQHRRLRVTLGTRPRGGKAGTRPFLLTGAGGRPRRRPSHAGSDS